MASDNMKKLKDIIAKNKIKYVDYKFIDVPGTWQHKTHPIAELDEDIFKYGTGFDGSSIRGFQGIEESDMLLIPDADTAFLDPFIREPTLSLTCDVLRPRRYQAVSQGSEVHRQEGREAHGHNRHRRRGILRPRA